MYISKVLQCRGGDQSTESKKARLEKWMSPALIIYHAYALSLAYLPVRSSCPHRMRDKVNGKAKYCQTLASLCLFFIFSERGNNVCRAAVVHTGSVRKCGARYLKGRYFCFVFSQKESIPKNSFFS